MVNILKGAERRKRKLFASIAKNKTTSNKEKLKDLYINIKSSLHLK